MHLTSKRSSNITHSVLGYTIIVKEHYVYYVILFFCYSLLDDAACPKIYQVQLTVVGFDQIHSGRYTVTISNRAGMLTFNFDRSLES